MKKNWLVVRTLTFFFLLSPNILSFWTYDVTNFPKVSRIIFSPIHHFRFSIFALETLELEWQCSQYLELNPTYATPSEMNLLPPATKLGQGNIFRSVCQKFCPQGAGHAWQGVHAQGGMHGRGVWGVCVCRGRGACVADTTRYGQWAGGTHPTGMYSCYL